MGKLTQTTAQVQAVINGVHSYTDGSHTVKEILRINNTDVNKGPFCLSVGDHDFEGVNDYWLLFGYNVGLDGNKILATEPVFSFNLESSYKSGVTNFLEAYFQWLGGSTYTWYRPLMFQINKATGELASMTISTSGKLNAVSISHNGDVEFGAIIKQLQLTGALTDGAPTDAEIDAITGLNPITAGAGWQCTIKDNNGTGLLYRVESDGADWFYTAMAKAL